MIVVVVIVVFVVVVGDSDAIVVIVVDVWIITMFAKSLHENARAHENKRSLKSRNHVGYFFIRLSQTNNLSRKLLFECHSSREVS